MIIQLDHLGDEPFDWQETLTLSTADLDRAEVEALGPIDVRGRLNRLDDGFFLAGSADYDQTTVCSRCLDPIETHETLDLGLLVIPRPEAETAEAERELEDDDLGLVFLNGPVLDTEPLIREQVQLQVPMRPLCREDCPGLCPTCGTKLAQATCDCAPPTDPRWAALAALRNES